MNISFENQDQCKRFSGDILPKMNGLINNAASSPETPIENTTEYWETHARLRSTISFIRASRK